MTEAWQLLGVALAAIAALFGVSWVKKKLEARGASKQRDAQVKLADQTEQEIAEQDRKIDEQFAPQFAQVERERAQLVLDTKRELNEIPTLEDVQRLLNGDD